MCQLSDVPGHLCNDINFLLCCMDSLGALDSSLITRYMFHFAATWPILITRFISKHHRLYVSWPSCSKLTKSLVNVMQGLYHGINSLMSPSLNELVKLMML